MNLCYYRSQVKHIALHEQTFVYIVFAHWMRINGLYHKNLSRLDLLGVVWKYHAQSHIHFEWDTRRMHRDLKTSRCNKTLTADNVAEWSGAVMQTELSPKTTGPVVSLEITLDNITTGVGVNGLMIGFVRTPRIDDVWYFGGPWDAGFFIHRDYVASYIMGEYRRLSPQWRGAKCKSGDRILMAFNFVTRECTVYWNEKEVGVITDRLPQSVYAMVSIHSPSMALDLERKRICSISECWDDEW